MRRIVIAVLSALWLAGIAQAQVQCADSDTIDGCLSKNMTAGRGGPSTEFVKQAAQTATPRVTSLIDKLLADASQPGAQGGAGNQATSTVTDFLPWLNLLGVVSDSDASDGSIALDLNFLLPLTTGPTGHNSQLKWVFNVKPEPYAPLVEAFGEDVRADRKAMLAARIDDTADSEIEFSWSLVTDTLGRDFARHHEQLNALYAPAIFKVMKDRPDDSLRLQFVAAINAFLNDPSVDFGDARDDPGELRLDDPRVAPLRARLQDLLQSTGFALGKGQAQVIKSLRAELEKSRLTQLSQLVLLQPQLLFSATRQFRDELVGPEAWGAKITFEKSFASFSDFMARNASACSAAALTEGGAPVDVQRAQPCYRALESYLDAHTADIESEDRLSFSLEYKKVDAVSYGFPDDGVALDVPKYDRLIASVGFGRALSRGGAKDRIDFEADYDSNLSGARGGQSRFIVAATYTRDIFGVTIPFSLVYANKSEFLGGVDKQISLHFGVKYKSEAPLQ